MDKSSDKNLTKIPKRIFYVWGANEPLKQDIKKYISGWKQSLPDYEIIQVDEDCVKYFDFKKALENPWFKTVYNRKMWAYVSDYIRCKVLYEHGGIYLDTDVEVLKNFDEFLNEPMFVGIQDSSQDGKFDLVEPAIMGAQKENLFLKKILSFYNDLIWKKQIYTMPQIFGFYLKEYNIEKFPKKGKQKIIETKDITIYPEEYFIPYRYNTSFDECSIVSKTVTIHHWNASWTDEKTIFFLNNKHKIPLEAMDASFKRYLRLKALIGKNKIKPEGANA